MSERNYYVICDDNCRFPGMTKEQIIAAISSATGSLPSGIDDAFITKLKEMNKNKSVKIWIGTQAEYNALDPKPSNTLCIITDEQDETRRMISDLAQDIQGLKDGTIRIDFATNCQNATNASEASHASNASYATSAGSATNASKTDITNNTSWITVNNPDSDTWTNCTASTIEIQVAFDLVGQGGYVSKIITLSDWVNSGTGEIDLASDARSGQLFSTIALASHKLKLLFTVNQSSAGFKIKVVKSSTLYNMTSGEGTETKAYPKFRFRSIR